MTTKPMVTRPFEAAGVAEATVQAPAFLGFDFGTSGARAIVTGADGDILCDVKKTYSGDAGGPASAEAWVEALTALLDAIPVELRQQIAALSLDATSATTLIVDRRTGQPVCNPMMYHDSFPGALPAVKAIAPPHHTTTAATSTLCKLVAWWADAVDDHGHVLTRHSSSQASSLAGLRAAESMALAHQADWLLAQLLGWSGTVTTDYNNALKLGYDPEAEEYPPWLSSQPYAPLLPRVVAPGAPLGRVAPAAAAKYGLPPNCLVVAGTTDSIAAFLAAKVSAPGEAVTSLGSTLAVKLLSTTRVDDARYGIYSHRLGDGWLVGGASNTGGAVLRSFFTDAQLAALSADIDPASPSGLDYYPLLRPGERFPVADPDLEPRLTPRPQSDVLFLHGLLESIARIEACGYQLLQKLGASPLSLLATAGGGSKNATWTSMRERVIGVRVTVSENAEAAFGAALLARNGHSAVASVAL